MAMLPILRFPDPKLRTKAKAIAEITPAIKVLAADMFETMYAAKGIGLAATQVDRHIRLIVMDLSETHDNPQVYINPVLTPLTTDTKPYDEGCLSVPEFYESVARVSRVRVQALDLDGNPLDFEADELLAICIQHEMDHLDGILFVDHISALKRKRIRDALEKAERERKREASKAAKNPASKGDN